MAERKLNPQLMQVPYRTRQVDLSRLFPVRRFAVPGARWLIGLALLAGLLTFFWGCGVFSPPPGPGPRASWGAALFFSVNVAYIVPIYGYITERTAAALQAVVPALEASPETVAGWRSRVTHKPVRWFVTVLATGTAAGVLHNVLLWWEGNLRHEASVSAAVAAVIAGTQLIWIVFTLVIAALLDNALILNSAARHVRVGPFHTHHLRPFATVAVISTLALIGAQAAFPIMSIEGGLDPLAYIPGLLATGGSMLLLAALPIWPLHRRLVNTKRAILRDLDHHIGRLPLPDPELPQTLERLAPLLAYRREVSLSPEWPFDIGVLTRLGLYLIIPPLTWVGAALIENVVEAFL